MVAAVPGGVTGAKMRVSRFGEDDDPSQPGLKFINHTFNKLVTFSNDGAAVEWGSTPLIGLPKSDIIVVGGVLDLDVSEDPLSGNISNTYTVTCALGTTATADNSLATTEIDLATAIAATIASASVTPHIKRVMNGAAISSIVDAGATTAKYLDNNAGTLAIFLNMTLPDADVSGLGSLRVKGLVRAAVLSLGRNS